MDVENRLERIETRLCELDADVRLAVNYMRELASLIGARERLAIIDAQIAARDADGIAPSDEVTLP